MSEAMEALARALGGRKSGDSLVMGQILSKRPLRVLVEGNTQDRDSLLASGRIDSLELEPGDRVAMWPIEDHQRYVILTKVVSL